ncbi:MAG: type IV toxin-antitoxin system AbiEi family antitoxin [Silvanigrellaceae bacterium]|nr:type IV toxin-antitoxin system AbiEi family antitoxin [Silvanigrellaceae bacterium]
MNFPNYLKVIRQAGKHYFTLKQAMSDLNLSANATLAAIHRLRARGDLISPAKGLYVIVPPEYQPQGSIPAEELVPILMHHLKADYYVSLLSGAQYYGASHQKPGCFQIISNKRVKHPLVFGQVKIELIFKKTVDELPTQNVTVRTGYLKVATPELIAFDLLSYLSRSGGLNHIATVFSELIEAIDIDKIIQLADKLGEKTWLQRLGYILEQLDPMDKEKVEFIIFKLQQYLNEKMKVFAPLAPELPKIGCPRIKKWMIIANTDIESDL